MFASRAAGFMTLKKAARSRELHREQLLKICRTILSARSAEQAKKSLPKNNAKSVCESRPISLYKIIKETLIKLLSLIHI